MNISKLIDKAEEFLCSKESKLKKKIKCVEYVLKKLRKREKKLKGRIENNEGDKESMETEIKLIKAQRKKGLTNLKAFRKEKASS